MEKINQAERDKLLKNVFKTNYYPGKEKDRKEMASRFLFAMVLLFLLTFSRHRIIGESMYPTYTENQVAVGCKAFMPLHRGDVVVAANPDFKLLIKRLVGMPGDTVVITPDGSVLVNGEKYEYGAGSAMVSPVFKNMQDTEDGGKTITLGTDEYFLLGDNFEHSADSRYYGTFSRLAIIEKIIHVF